MQPPLPLDYDLRHAAQGCGNGRGSTCVEVGWWSRWHWALSLVAAACGGDDSGEGATSGTVDEDVKAGAQQALGGSATTAAAAAKHPTSMAEWEALWEKERAAVVKRIKDNKWGLSADGKTITGPEGFTIDIAKCPAGWNNTEGLTDTEIKIGSPTPLSGTFGDAGNYSKGGGATMKFYSDARASSRTAWARPARST